VVLDLAELLGKVQVAAGVVRDGDTLVLRLPNQISRHQFDEFIETVSAPLKEKLPNVELVFLAGIEELLVYRPSESV
jgi:hypothetical protein